MKKFLMTLSIALIRVLSVLFNYLLIRVLGITEFAIYSNFISVSNFSYQLGKLGYEYEFQKLIFDSDQQNNGLRKKDINTIFFAVSFSLAILSSIIAFLVIKFGFAEAEDVFYIPYLSFLLFVVYLFLFGYFISNMYGAFNMKAMTLFIGLNFISYTIVALSIIFGYLENLVLFYAALMLISVSITIVFYCPFSFSLKKLSSFQDMAKSAIERTLPIYANNTSIILIQILLIGIVSYSSFQMIAEYRVLQSIQAILAMVPLSLAVFLVNQSQDKDREEVDYFLMAHIYIVIASIVLLFTNVLVFLYPKYEVAIVDYFLLFVVFNSLTIISNSFIFSHFQLMNRGIYYKSLAIALLVNILICVIYDIKELKDLILVDWVIQINFFFCIVLASIKFVSSKKYLFLNLFYFFLIAFSGLYLVNLSKEILIFLMLICSSFYLIRSQLREKIRNKIYKGM